jgi:hypothetical protein
LPNKSKNSKEKKNIYILDAIILSKLQTKKKNSKEKKFWTPFTPSCRPAEVQTHSFFHFTPKVFPLTKELLPPSITSACRPPRSSSRRHRQIRATPAIYTTNSAPPY